MSDMTPAIVPKSDQWNADDFIAGPQTFTIREVTIRPGEQPVSIFFTSSDKAYRPCKSMCRVLVQTWGPDAKKYAGRSLTLYRDPTAKWAGIEIGGIRISHLSHIDREIQMQLTVTRGSRKPFVVKPLVTQVQSAAVPELDRLIAQAREQAGYGSAVLKEHWERLNKGQRQLLAPVLAELKKIAEDADAAVEGAAEPPTPDREPGDE